jgi:putative membrane protein
VQGVSDSGGGDAQILALERPHKNLLVLYALQSCMALCLAPLLFVPFLCKYVTLRYRFDDEGVSVSWGVLFRREVVLTYRRIQDIHIKRNVIERWLGIGTVEVQTASGSSKAELAVEGVADYEGVRDFLYRRMRGHELGVGRPQAAAAGQESVLGLLAAIRAELEGARRALEERGR